MKRSPLHILLVDDDVDYLFFCQRVLAGIPAGWCSVNTARGADEAIAYMMGEGEFSNRHTSPFPSLVLSDLNMVEGDGFDLLQFMQANPEWNVVPRILISASNDDDDVRTAYSLGASVCHQKPVSYDELSTLIHSIVEYWNLAEIAPSDETGRIRSTCSDGRLGARFPKPSPAEQMVRIVKRASPSQPTAKV